VVPIYSGASGARDLRIGTGACKLGLNYAPGVLPQKEAAALGYVQNLWLYGPEHHLTEVFMNHFTYYRNPNSTCRL